MRQSLIPDALRAAIEQQIGTFPQGRLQQLVDDSLEEGGGAPLAIKYVPARWAKSYTRPGGTLWISNTPGFTWGNGVYVTPLVFPVSSAIFGRVGVVARFRPAGWRVFDATLPLSQELYMQWVYSQPRRRQLMLTAHSQVANQFLRNLFRTTFHIDCVLFNPDQRNRFYTDHTDVWMAVSDWSQDELVRTGGSTRFQEPRMVVIVEEEFEPGANDIRRTTLIGPRSPRTPNAAATTAIRRAYAGFDVVHLHA
jgi:hypothetical protein